MWVSHKRQLWLDTFSPIQKPTIGLPFRRKWYKRSLWEQLDDVWAIPLQQEDIQQQEGEGLGTQAPPVVPFDSNVGFPKINEIASGLVIPHNVIEDNDYDSLPHLLIQDAMMDLVEYVESGRFRSAFLSEPDALEIELSIIRIAQEEGLKVEDGGA